MNPERITELAREAARKLNSELLCRTPLGTANVIQSALETLAKEHAAEIAKRDAAIKVARGALTAFENCQGTKLDATCALTKIDQELAP